MSAVTKHNLVVGGRYNWRHDRLVRLTYTGTCRYPGDLRTWYQFERVDEPGTVWCEVFESDLHLFEVTVSIEP